MFSLINTKTITFMKEEGAVCQQFEPNVKVNLVAVPKTIPYEREMEMGSCDRKVFTIF